MSSEVALFHGRRFFHGSAVRYGPKIVRMSERYIHPMQEMKVKDLMAEARSVCDPLFPASSLT